MASALAYLAQGEAVGSVHAYPLQARIANAAVSYVAYIGKMIWPDNLTVFYPYPETIPMWQTAGSGLILLILSVVFVKVWRSRPYFLVGWLWYIGTLIPVIGLVQVGDHAMANRYTYIPFVGLFVMIAWGVPELLRRWRYERVILAVLTGLLLLILDGLVKSQNAIKPPLWAYTHNNGRMGRTVCPLGPKHRKTLFDNINNVQ